MYNPQNYWVLLSIIPNNRKHNVPEMDLFPSSGEGREISTLLGPLERANFYHFR
jgi:hypothetical protein